MKLTVILLTVGFLNVHATGVSQNVSFSGKNVPLEKVFSSVKKQTGFVFVYTDPVIKASKPVTINAENLPVEQFLLKVFETQPLQFDIRGKNIFISPKASPQPSRGTSNHLQDTLRDVRGRVVDEQGNPLVGANVKVKGSNVGTTTDAQGKFSLNNVDRGAVLEVSFVGYEMQNIPVRGKSVFSVVLGRKLSLLDETVVIAYGTTTKRLNTGNIATVRAADIEKQPVQNPLLALQGRVPGLYITQSTGLPGTGLSVRVQGANSIAGGNDPLYVIDGVPFISQTLATATVGDILQNSSPGIYQSGGYGNPLSYINPNDIESIEVLKDADATSIYGSRAANGAILITTKKGKIGATQIDIGIQQGGGKVARTMKLMNTQQYLEMRREALINDGLLPDSNSDYDLTLWNQNRNTEWVKSLIGGTAKYTNINGSISGGNANIQYLIGATYKRETTVYPGTFSDQKGGTHFNLNSTSANQKFRIQLTCSYLVDKNILPRVDLTGEAYTLAPNAPTLYNADGTLNWELTSTGNSSWKNPLSYLYNKYENKTDNLISSILLNYRLSSSFELSSRFGYTKLHTDEFAATSILSQRPERKSTFIRDASYSLNEVKIYIVEPQLNYKKNFGKFKIDGLVGVTIQQNASFGQNITGIGYPTDDLTKDIHSATNVFINSTLDALYKYNAIFGRLNCNRGNKYILNVNVRRDGSSHFGPENRFHNFASVGMAWIFSEEEIIKKNISFLSFGKIKVNYGTTGNDQIGDYTFMDLYGSTTTVPYQGSPSIAPTALPSPYLQWEETRKLSMGIELGFLNDKILLNGYYGRNRSSNQLLAYNLPSITGFSSVNKNFPATVQNTNWEFMLSSVNIRNSIFEWKTSINFTVTRNVLAAFPNIQSSSYANFYIIGQPVNLVRAYHYAGVNQNTGIYQFTDKNGDTTNYPSFFDRTVLIDINPKFYGGLQSNLRFKNIYIDFLLQFVKKRGVAQKFGYGFPPGTANLAQPNFLLNRWQKPGDIKTIQKYNASFALYEPFSNASLSDANYSDASFIRLKNVSLSYELSKSLINKIGVRRCNFYMQAQNLFTLTKYEGIDPENTSFSVSPLNTWTVGMQLGL